MTVQHLMEEFASQTTGGIIKATSTISYYMQRSSTRVLKNCTQRSIELMTLELSNWITRSGFPSGTTKSVVHARAFERQAFYHPSFPAAFSHSLQMRDSGAALADKTY